MKCPTDGTTLVMADRNGVEIDYCPACRGVWLDRGELDKIIERSAPQHAPVQTAMGQRRDYDDDYEDYDDRRDRKGKRRGGGFLSELFDFD
ncbi:zf-TFIIB domain-containing protein [Actibacterium sp. 188UL27-1]|uniref:TFIIB-type zinc ribbon-containing protein n=1 Tax=Actibacterium sp. 188UL27-1 TaxID=2786961 RepID=UPI00195D41F6|nr:zf-TFIIB domain-containing protein [Actibacterium sp. 188UL27-1]MBM7066426.1 zf-TFIIB domain-containing protein [Actibacterium sp. 188UL27-1]